MTTVTLDRVKAVRNPLSYREMKWLKRPILGVWAMMHAAMLLSIYLLNSMSHRSFDSTIQAFDAVHFQDIAANGYWNTKVSPYEPAYFPGFPIALWLVHLVTTNWVAAELLVSFIAGGFAVTGLERLHPQAPKFLLTAPSAIFLMIGYSESLFLAFVVWAWIMARHRRWYLVGWLTLGADATRVNGLFFLAAMVTCVVCSHTRWRRRLSAMVRLWPALTPPVMYELYLWSHSGDWLLWMHDERLGWYRQLTSPIRSWETSWRYCSLPSTWGVEAKLEIFAAIVIAVAVVVLAVDRDWPAVVYCGITLISLTTSTCYLSIPRDMMTLFPIWLLLAWAPRVVQLAWLTVVAPVMVMISYFYLTGQWAG